VPTQSLIPPALSLSTVPTGDAFLDALQAHDAHFGGLRAEAARQGGGGAVLRYVGVIEVNSENGSVSVKASLEQCAAPFNQLHLDDYVINKFADTRRRIRLQRHLVDRIISSCFIPNATVGVR
jgi:hypothetical protein